MRQFKNRSAVLLDPHPLWLTAMEKLLMEVGITVVGRATGGDQAVDLVAEHRPDVLVAGVDVGNPDQVTCIARAKQIHPEMKAVVVDDCADPVQIDAAFAAGAAVYCVKTAEQDDLASAIRQVFERLIYLATGAPSAADAVRPSTSTEVASRDLTRRELEILRLVAEGSSNSQLAKMLWVTEQTVKFHLSNIYRKLDVANRTEARRWAQLHRLLPANPSAVVA